MSQVKETKKAAEEMPKELEKDLSQKKGYTEVSAISEVIEQDLIKILDKIGVNQKQLTKSMVDLNATYLSIMSDIVQKNLTGTYEKCVSPFGNPSPSKIFEGEAIKSYEAVQTTLLNSIQLNNKLILNLIDLAVASNRLYSTAFVNDYFVALFSPPRTS
jgi:hypothetical protein